MLVTLVNVIEKNNNIRLESTAVQCVSITIQCARAAYFSETYELHLVSYYSYH